MRVLIDDVANNRETFEALHAQNYIGSSTIAAIAGLNPWQTQLDVWCGFTGRKSRQIPDSPIMKLGREIEPLLGRMYEETTGKKTVPYNKVLQHDTLDWAIASPDFRCAVDGGYELVEAKNTKISQVKKWEDSVPDYYLCQLQWQLGIDRDAQAGNFAALIGGDADLFKTPHIERNDDIFEQLLEHADRFLSLVKSDTPPDAQAGDDKLIRELCKPVATDLLVLTQAETGRLFEELADLEEKRKSLLSPVRPVEDRIEALKNTIRLKCGDHSTAVCGAWQVTFKQVCISPKPATSYFKMSIKELL